MLKIVSSILSNQSKMRETPPSESIMSPIYGGEKHTHSNSKACRILVLGEPSVGKTSFINALSNYALGIHETPLPEMELPTTKTYTKTIPCTTSEKVITNTMEEDIINYRYSHSFIDFVLRPHGKDKIDAIDHERAFNSRIEKNRSFKEIAISEVVTNREEPIDSIAKKFDKIIIMSEYSDITTMRSMQYWATRIKSPKTKTIICVNKCDVEIDDRREDFKLRKAKVMDHFLHQCAIEYISVKTGANVGFIYKYI